ncbi:hypothetical protein I503_03190 [Candida albicans SC5314]|uniref:Transcriptional regulator of yeast form adherence 6 n=1 Tax=Candida albicans (strain SC5314 / ATCC MYA-2876) TaxID=237561 RepID=TRY6_CANAL|nr:Try6p [Candida albicans SC5314]Q5ADL8.1 RecName: Full=Transcriptional regulator of yeast form adherence 6 [Candida albicans SC5314]AOW28685.1 Try6p [Candida albicans SC5314]KHC79220.1 hypothetical protein W5Q_03190 [Candida albicans SC5314]KHC86983.1 hypothetical protein I503_03190 [Candida albicans SC5314]|eukprot:XP_719917.1 Try6p [Candida albicans SC5314]
MSLPSPPVLKTTIIQLNKELDPEDDNNNYEILTNDYNNYGSSNTSDAGSIPTSPIIEVSGTTKSGSGLPNKKKRRRSTANIDSEELAKRKNETKQLHSIIEKRRRIKINREFEALKYLIPACRNCNTGSSGGSATPTSSTKKASTNSNNNGNKIDGMYKLTILKSSVEYILYLHHIIQKQHQLLSSISAKDTNGGILAEKLKAFEDFDIDFAKVPLNVNQYRNIDKDFNFKDLMQDLDGRSVNTESPETIIEENEPVSETSSTNNTTTLHYSNSSVLPSRTSSIVSSRQSSSLPTPELTPILSILNKYSTSNNQLNNRKNSNPISPQTVCIKSQNPSPFTMPMKSSLSTSIVNSPSSSSSLSGSKSYMAGNNAVNTVKFSLPDPVVNPNSTLNDNIPRKGLISGIPEEEEEEKINKGSANTETVNSGSASSDENNDNDRGVLLKLTDQDVSKTLLALRKSSIDSLLN